MIKTLFAMDREKKPAVIFIDEIDSLCGSRSDNENDATRRVKTEFLVQMQGVGNDDTGVLVLGATNLPWSLDLAIKRRFEKRIMIPLPDPEARRRMFELNVGTTPCLLSSKDYRLLADKTDGYSGSDIAIVVRDAIMQPVRKLMAATHFKPVSISTTTPTTTMTKLTPCSPGDEGAIEKTWSDLNSDELQEPALVLQDFLRAISVVKPSVDSGDVRKYDEWANAQGSD